MLSRPLENIHSENDLIVLLVYMCNQTTNVLFTYSTKNGISDRKHIHITYLGTSKVSQQIWVDASFTSTFLGNLLHSSALHDNKSPCEVLNENPPLYTLLLVFGFKWFPDIHLYMKTKLDPKSLTCIFVGIMTIQRIPVLWSSNC